MSHLTPTATLYAVPLFVALLWLAGWSLYAGVSLAVEKRRGGEGE